MITDVHHSHAGALAHRIVDLARLFVRLRQHHDHHVGREIFREQTRRAIPRTDVRGDENGAAGRSQGRFQVLFTVHDQLGVACVGALDTERFRKAGRVAREGSNHVALLTQKTLRAFDATKVPQHASSRLRQRKRKRSAEELRTVLDHETRTEASPRIGEAPQESAVWTKGASQLARSRVMPRALRQAPAVTFPGIVPKSPLRKALERTRVAVMAGTPKATTTDSLYGGAVSLRQPASGYRVNVDAILLAAFAAQGRRAKFAVDLGAGVGGVALGLHHLKAATRFALVEREATLLELAAENARRAELDAEFCCCDLSAGLPPELRQRADLVVSNPPFFAPETGRQSAEMEKMRARFGELAPFLDAASAAINGTRSRVVFIYPARELHRFLSAAGHVQLVPKRLRLVHADASSPARVALIQMQRAKPGGLVVLPPLFEWQRKGVRSPEVEAMLRGARADSDT